VKNIGKKDADRYVPYLTTAFFFILFMNWLGLIPNMATATGNLAVTAALAICTFVITQVAGIRSAGLGAYLAHLTGGAPWWLWVIMIPVEVLGLFTKPFALMVRLFANMLAGHLVLFFLLGLIFMLHPALAVVSVPMAAAIYMLELFVGLVQAYIFTMLSALFIGMSVAMAHHGHDDAHGHGEAHGGAVTH
jgi:F-type H+-transporting ATPase subunit a